MAENTTTRIVDVQVNTTDAIKLMAEYQLQLEESQKAEKKLRAEIKEREKAMGDAGKATDGDRRQLATLKEQQKAYSAQIRELSREVQNNIKSEQLYKDTLKGLGAELSSAKDKLRQMQLGTAEYAKQEKHVAALNEQMKEAEEAYGVFSRNVGNYPDMKPLNTQLEEITKTLAQMKYEGQDTSEEFNNLLLKASQMRDAIDDTQKQIAAGASDTAPLDGLLQSAQGLAGAWGLWNSAIGANIEENSESAEMMKNLQVAMTALASITAVMNSLQKQSAMMVGVRNMQTAAQTAAIKLNTATQSQNIVIQKAAIITQKALNAVAYANPYVLLAAAVVSVVGALALFASNSSKSKQQLAEFNNETEKTDRILKQMVADSNFDVRLAEAAGKSGRELLEMRRENAKEELAVLDESFEKQQKLYNAANKKTRKKMQEAYDKLVEDRQAAWDKLKAIDDEITIEEVKSATEAEKKKAEIRKEYADQRTQALKTELADIRAALDAEIALMAEGAAKDLATENERHKRKIEDLKKRLETEKNLTEVSRTAINRMIETEEQQHELNVAKLKSASDLERINKEQQNIALRLAAVKQGTDAEYTLKVEQLRKQQEAELANIELTEQQKVLIREKYNKQLDDLSNQWINANLQKQNDALRLEWENRINAAAVQGQNTLQLQLQMRQAELIALQQMEGESDAAFKARQLGAQQAYVDAKRAINDYEVQIEQAKLEALAAVTNGLSGLLEELGEDNKTFAVLSKTLALAEIAINTGKAIAAGTAQAQSVPFPGNLIAIATTVATIMANITSAIKTVKSAKFSTGGYVSGPGTSTSDSIPAMLSDGESVNAAFPTSMFAPIYSALNQLGGGAPIVAAQSSNQIAGEDMLARAFAKGVSQLDMRVGVDEITRVSDRVKVVESLGDL
jgi:hypothetical protein